MIRVLVQNTLMVLFHCMVRHGKVWYSSHLGGFLLDTVPDTWYFFAIPPRLRFQVNRTISKMWCVNSADHWFAGEYCHCELATDTQTDRPARLKSAQPVRDWTQPKHGCLVVFWGSTDVPLVQSQEVDPARACLMERCRVKTFFRSHGSRGSATITTCK